MAEVMHGKNYPCSFSSKRGKSEKPVENEDVQKMVEHTRYDSQILAEFIEHFIVGYDQAHVGQITAHLS